MQSFWYLQYLITDFYILLFTLFVKGTYAERFSIPIRIKLIMGWHGICAYPLVLRILYIIYNVKVVYCCHIFVFCACPAADVIIMPKLCQIKNEKRKKYLEQKFSFEIGIPTPQG